MKRKHLTSDEINKLLVTVLNQGRSYRDYCMITMAFIHGLRVSELISLRIDDYDPLSSQIYVHRLKGGMSTIHPLLSAENLVLQRWINERRQWAGKESSWLFLSQKGGKLSRQRFYNIVKDYGVKANLPLTIHPHMLRHACGYNLADRGNDTRLIQDYLGHRNIRHTVRYTATNAARFACAWSKDAENPLILPK